MEIKTQTREKATKTINVLTLQSTGITLAHTLQIYTTYSGCVEDSTVPQPHLPHRFLPRTHPHTVIHYSNYDHS